MSFLHIQTFRAWMNAFIDAKYARTLGRQFSRGWHDELDRRAAKELEERERELDEPR